MIISATRPTTVHRAHFIAVNIYVSKPKGHSARGNKTSVGVLYLTDVYGVQLAQNTL